MAGTATNNNPMVQTPMETVKKLTNLQDLALLRNGKGLMMNTTLPNATPRNPEASGVHENFAPEVKISDETGDKASWKFGDEIPEMEIMGPVADRQTLREILEVVLVTKKK